MRNSYGAEEIAGWIFSHAGFSKTWVDTYFKKQLHVCLDKLPEEDNGKGEVWDESEFSIKFLNDFFQYICQPQRNGSLN